MMDDNAYTLRDISPMIEQVVGDVPVSVQLNAALEQMAAKNHTHPDYVSRKEYDALKQVVEDLVALVGDESVAAQINNAMKPFVGV